MILISVEPIIMLLNFLSMNDQRKILIPTDFSEYSIEAIDYVLSTGPYTESHLYLMHVVVDPLFVFPRVDYFSGGILKDLVDEAGTALNQLIYQKIGESRKVTAVVRRGEPYREIIRFAHEEEIDLIVMSTHGRAGLTHGLLGSIAEKVVRHTPTTVVLVKPRIVRERLSHASEPGARGFGVNT